MARWQELVASWDAAPSPPLPTQREWTWRHSAHGHEGVLVQRGQLIWYRHSPNPHLATGGAQSLDDFLARGPLVAGPSEAQLRALYRVVCALRAG